MINLRIIRFFTILAVMSISCQRDVISIPQSTVHINQPTYRVKDSVRFQFQGDADMITFYSGERGHEYRHRDRVLLEGGDLLVNIETNVLYGVQKDNLKLLMSTDFSGKYTKDDLTAATWTDISDRLEWSTGTRLISKDANVTDLLIAGRPLYFGFKYAGAKSTTGTAQQRTWRVYQFNIHNKFSESEIIPVTNRAEAGWQAITNLSSDPDLGVWNLTGYPDMITYVPESNLNDVEKWVVSKRFDPNKVAPDRGVAIKKYPDSPLKEFKYAFTEAGEYEVTFVFVNANYSDQKEVVQTVKVIVE